MQHETTVMYIIQHIFYATLHTKLKSRTRWLLLYGRAASFRKLPFASLRDIEDMYQRKHRSTIKEYHKHLSVTHLNTQSMSSNFDRFQVMIIENQFDVVT